MRAHTEIEIYTTLVLDDNEAEWLKGIMQNPLHDGETARDNLLRERLFQALKDARPLPRPA